LEVVDLNMRAPHLYPDLVRGFRGNIGERSIDMRTIAAVLALALASSVGPSWASTTPTCSIERAMPDVPTRAHLISFQAPQGFSSTRWVGSPIYSRNKRAQYYSDTNDLRAGWGIIYESVETMPAARDSFGASHPLDKLVFGIGTFLSNNFPPIVANVLCPILYGVAGLLFAIGALISGDGPPTSDLYAVNATGARIALRIDSAEEKTIDPKTHVRLFFPRGQHLFTATSGGTVVDSFTVNPAEGELIVYNAAGANEFTMIVK